MSETTTAPAPAAGAADPMDAWVRAASSGEPPQTAPVPQQPAQPAQPDRQPAQPERPETQPESPNRQPGQGDTPSEGEPQPGEQKPEDSLSDEERAERKRLAIEAREARRAARQAAEEAERYRAELDRQRGAQGGQETEEQRIERRAAELIASRAHAERVNAFNQKCNEIYDLGVKDLGDQFTDAIEDLKGAKVLSPALIEAADEAAGKDAHRVLAYLGEHADEAKRLVNLTPERLGAAVARIAAKATAAPPPRQRSSAPPPVRGVVGAGSARGEPDPETMPIADWIAQEEKRSAQRGRY